MKYLLLSIEIDKILLGVRIEKEATWSMIEKGDSHINCSFSTALRVVSFSKQNISFLFGSYVLLFIYEVKIANIVRP